MKEKFWKETKELRDPVMCELPICILTCIFCVHCQQRNYDKSNGGEEDYTARSHGPEQMEGNDSTCHI